jgi:putative NADPH-quinone reductase
MAGQNFDDRMHHLTHATMAFCGYDVIQYKSYHSVGYAPAEVRASYLEDIHNYVKNLDQQPIMDKMSQ